MKGSSPKHDNVVVSNTSTPEYDCLACVGPSIDSPFEDQLRRTLDVHMLFIFFGLLPILFIHLLANHLTSH